LRVLIEDIFTALGFTEIRIDGLAAPNPDGYIGERYWVFRQRIWCIEQVWIFALATFKPMLIFVSKDLPYKLNSRISPG
jgi:hypothetical protein